MTAEERISPEAAALMRSYIVDNAGNEVVFVCDLGGDGVVNEVIPVARGASDAAPAPPELMKRGRVVIHNHPSGALQPSRADVYNAGSLSDYGVGSYIVDNDVTRVKVVCEPAEPREIRLLDADTLAAVIDDGGELARHFPHFEPRPSQVRMLREVAVAFNTSTLLAVEAGTGVGKSLAYLIPAIDWAAANDERVVISTATINLQQQLIDKDIPMVLDLLGHDVRAVLVKGRGNYLCQKRLNEALDEATLFEEPDEELLALKKWAGESETGSRSDAPFHPSDDLWSRVNSDADSCADLSCRLRERCFFARARREAAGARILVVNHHLLFIDLYLRVRGIGFDARAILPPFRRLVFDEAHSIENSATSLFSESLSVFSIRKHVRRLYRERRNRKTGLLPLVAQRGTEAKLVEKSINSALEVSSVAERANSLVVQLSDEPAMRLTPGMDEHLRRAILGTMEELQGSIVALCGLLADIVDAAESGEDDDPYHDVRITARRLDRIAMLCRNLIEFEDNPDRVFWIEYRRAANGERYARFVSTPLEIGEIMQEAVYEPFETVVFTSATLTVADTFSYWASRIGLDELSRESKTVMLPSPFVYAENALLAVPSDAPEPSSEEYQPFLLAFLGELLELTEGGALVLFTSYQMLGATHEGLREKLEARGIACLRQGQDDRARLLARFNEDSSSVLFATESFWQGVDAPGDTLKLVVLCRLPFRVPSDPVLTARTELIESRGGNAFTDLALPEAVMKLRQGFGRLIRRASDRGVVVVSDVRVLTRTYGSLFLNSLPETPRSTKRAAGVLEDVERFLYP